MIRAKGGRRQPRYFYLKERATIRLIGLMEEKKKKLTRAEEIYISIEKIKIETDRAIQSAKLKLKELECVIS